MCVDKGGGEKSIVRVYTVQGYESCATAHTKERGSMDVYRYLYVHAWLEFVVCRPTDKAWGRAVGGNSTANGVGRMRLPGKQVNDSSHH